MRCGLVVAALVSLTPGLSGCVSAVDESSAFGFAPGTPDGGGQSGASVAAAETDESAASSAPADPQAPDAPQAGESLAAASRSEAGLAVAEASPGKATDGAVESPQPATKALVAETSNEGGIRPTALLSPASNPAVAAYAAPAGGKQADHSLYASLFTQSEAKTPLKNAEAGKSRRVVVLQTQGTSETKGDDALPGVDPKSLFEIGQRASVDSDLLDDIGGSYQIASLTGIARLAPSGLMIQRDDVVTNCFDSNLMGLISQIESRFKQKVVITSGFRSPSHNRRVNGAKASMHMACKAADLHVPGVNGLEVARFVRALPGRGGVGTYCHTSAIHIDVGARRDWNWACRRRQAS